MRKTSGKNFLFHSQMANVQGGPVALPPNGSGRTSTPGGRNGRIAPMDSPPTAGVGRSATPQEDPPSAVGGGRNAEPQETLIFVDVDGVLNVGVKDPGKSPVSFNEGNTQIALKLVGSGSEDPCAHRLVAVHRRSLGPWEPQHTFAKLFSMADLDVSEVFVSRLAQILRAAGERRRVVLSSNWRRPQHAKRVRRLEEVISRHLGEPFGFDDMTALKEESSPDLRLGLIGEYVAEYCAKNPDARLRILVLEDFYISAIGKWQCDGMKVDSVETAEKFLRSRAPPDTNVPVKLCHTYDSWYDTKSGLQVKVGIGISAEHFCKAMSFLGATCEFCGMTSRPQESIGKVGSPSTRTSFKRPHNVALPDTKEAKAADRQDNDASQTKPQAAGPPGTPSSMLALAIHSMPVVGNGSQQDNASMPPTPGGIGLGPAVISSQSSQRRGHRESAGNDRSQLMLQNMGFRRLTSQNGEYQSPSVPHAHGKMIQAGGIPSLPAIETFA